MLGDMLADRTGRRLLKWRPRLFWQQRVVEHWSKGLALTCFQRSSTSYGAVRCRRKCHRPPHPHRRGGHVSFCYLPGAHLRAGDGGGSISPWPSSSITPKPARSNRRRQQLEPNTCRTSRAWMLCSWTAIPCYHSQWPLRTLTETRPLNDL